MCVDPVDSNKLRETPAAGGAFTSSIKVQEGHRLPGQNLRLQTCPVVCGMTVAKISLTFL